MPRRAIKPAALQPEANGQQSLPFTLTGSQRKTAYALRLNAEAMCKESGLHCVGFATFTVGDEIPDPTAERGYRFQQVFDSKEASRRINNLNRRVLPQLFERAIIVTERHKSGAIHFHVLGVLRNRPDIRTGFDFPAFDEARQARARGGVNRAAEIRYKLAASDDLRATWQWLRESLPGYGFGRAELTPVKKTAEAVSSYISKYIEKNICNRLKEDKRKKLVRYLGEWTTVKEEAGEIVPRGDGKVCKLRPNDFGWGTKRATAWRWKARECAALIDVKTPEQAKQALGARWAYNLTWIWKRTGDDCNNWVNWTEDFTAAAAEETLMKFCSVEWQIYRLWLHRTDEWDLSGSQVEHRDDLREAVATQEWQSGLNIQKFLDATRVFEKELTPYAVADIHSHFGLERNQSNEPAPKPGRDKRQLCHCRGSLGCRLCAGSGFLEPVVAT